MALGTYGEVTLPISNGQHVLVLLFRGQFDVEGLRLNLIVNKESTMRLGRGDLEGIYNQLASLLNGLRPLPPVQNVPH